ncbi:MAG: hypothetical protein J07HB67_00268 [halophilic archaeon J07HB67]|nr:MAG: hypothetical protein J07HB67_00268 [halophilic archaeon J07HB67]
MTDHRERETELRDRVERLRVLQTPGTRHLTDCELAVQPTRVVGPSGADGTDHKRRVVVVGRWAIHRRQHTHLADCQSLYAATTSAPAAPDDTTSNGHTSVTRTPITTPTTANSPAIAAIVR